MNLFTAIATLPDEGESMYTLGPHMTVKLSSAATNGLYFPAVEETPSGIGPALHVHHQQDDLFQYLRAATAFSFSDRNVKSR